MAERQRNGSFTGQAATQNKMWRPRAVGLSRRGAETSAATPRPGPRARSGELSRTALAAAGAKSAAATAAAAPRRLTIGSLICGAELRTAAVCGTNWVGAVNDRGADSSDNIGFSWLGFRQKSGL